MRSRDHEHRLCPALARGHRLVAAIGVAREDPRLRICVSGKRGARGRFCPLRRAPRNCRSRNPGRQYYDIAAGKDHGPVTRCCPRTRAPERPSASGTRGASRPPAAAGDRDGCPAVARARRELERQPIVGPASSGRAPMRFSCEMMYSPASRSPGDPASRPSRRSEASASTCALAFDAATGVWPPSGTTGAASANMTNHTAGFMSDIRFRYCLGGAFRSASRAFS